MRLNLLPILDSQVIGFSGRASFWLTEKENMLYVSSPLCLHRDHGKTTRIVLERNGEGQRMREYSKAIQQILCLQGIHGALSALRAFKFGWWDWSYDQYLCRYKPLFFQRLIGFPQCGIHLIGYWVYRIRAIARFRRLTCLSSSRARTDADLLHRLFHLLPRPFCYLRS